MKDKVYKVSSKVNFCSSFCSSGALVFFTRSSSKGCSLKSVLCGFHPVGSWHVAPVATVVSAPMKAMVIQ